MSTKNWLITRKNINLIKNSHFQNNNFIKRQLLLLNTILK